MPSHSGGAAQGEPGPHVAECRDQGLDVGVAVQRRGGQAQALGAARHGRVIDRLDIDAVTLQKLVAGGFARAGVAGWLGEASPVTLPRLSAASGSPPAPGAGRVRLGSLSSAGC